MRNRENPFAANRALLCVAFLTASLARGFALPPGSPEFVTANWRVEHGLPENNINGVLQTRDGYLWIATWNGLARFDGVRFVRFGLADGLKTTATYLLHEDRQGNLWVGTYDGGVSLYRDGQFRSFTRSEGLPSDNVGSLTEDRTGNLWVGCHGGVARWDGHRFLRETPGGDALTNQSWNVAAAYDGSVWAKDGEQELWRWHDGRWTPMPTWTDPVFRANVPFFTRDGRIWRRLNPGHLARLEGDVWRIVSLGSGLPDSFCRSVLERSDGSLMVGTFEDGLFLFRDDHAVPVAYCESPRKDGILSLCEDREGNLWLGTRTFGLTRLRTRRLALVPGTELLRRNRSVTLDALGRLWAGGELGLFLVREGQPIRVKETDVGAKIDAATTLLPRNRGGIWFGDEYGLARYDPDRDAAPRRLWPADQSEPYTNSVWALADDGGDGVWFGTGNGRLGHARGDAVEWLALPEVATGKKIGALLREPGGGLWVGTEGGGLHRIENGHVTLSLTTRDGLPVNSVRCLHFDLERTLWMGTYGGGLVRYRDGKLSAFNIPQGLPDSLISAILEDADGMLWCAATIGFFRVDKQALDDVAAGRAQSAHPLLVGASEGLVESEPVGGSTPNALRGPDGVLYFPTVQGIYALDPAKFRGSFQPPPVRIEEALVDGKPVQLTPEYPDAGAPQSKEPAAGLGSESNSMIPQFNTLTSLRIPPGSAQLDVRYTAFHFAAPETLRFRHRLDGVDADWTEVGNQRVATFRRLPPGQYRFRVTAADSAGSWNATGATLSFLVAPHVWQTWWFRTAGGVAAAVAGASLYARRIAQLRRRQVEQAEFARRLIASQEAERERIARELHDSLGQNLQLINNRLQLGLERHRPAPLLAEELQKVSTLTRQAISEVRSISYALRPTELEQIGLTQAIEWLAEKTAESAGFKCVRDLDPMDGLFSGENEINLYRIVQEALNNIVKHAAATEVTLEIKREPLGMRLSLFDNGRGLSGAVSSAGEPRRTGLGMSGMRERARILGGEFELMSTPGKGTRITLTIPLWGRA